MPSTEQRWAIAGLLLATLLLTALISVISENVAQARDSRDRAEFKMLERARCNALNDRLGRDQCLLDLRVADQAQLGQR